MSGHEGTTPDSYQGGSKDFDTILKQSAGRENPCELAGQRITKAPIIAVPELNAVNFAAKLEKVRNWWNLGIGLLVLWIKLDEIERVYSSINDRLKAVYDYFKHMHPYANWRCVIWGLDESRDTDLADEIRDLAEPLTDSTLTVDNIIGVLKLMKSRWYDKLSHILAVPASKKTEIKQQFPSSDGQLRAFVEYIHAFHPRMSWDTLAGVLHSMEEHKALAELRAKGYLKTESDPSLTIENLKNSIRGMKNWHRFGWWLDVPLSKRDEIKSRFPSLEEQIDALLHEWLDHHPAPSWRLFAWALLRRREPPEHKMLKSLYGNYIPDDFISAEASLLKLFVKRVVKKNELLGRGTYGSVEVVLWHGVEYAAKRLRTDVRGRQKKAFYEQFRTEYDLLSSLNHPNIVGYTGLCFLQHSDQQDVPLLMMERLKIDLHTRLVDFSEEFKHPLTISEKRSIMLGVAEGLNYLHTHKPPVIHRDLTARNVLLDENNTAKIGDFGNSRILSIDQSSCIESMTCIPGTIVYSAPEALPVTSNTRYDVKIDIFSFGHLILFVCIDEFPSDLLQPVIIQPDNSKQGRSEVERRERYMHKLESRSAEYPNTDIYEIIVKCLDNRPDNRPTAEQLIEYLK